MEETHELDRIVVTAAPVPTHEHEGVRPIDVLVVVLLYAALGAVVLAIGALLVGAWTYAALGGVLTLGTIMGLSLGLDDAHLESVRPLRIELTRHTLSFGPRQVPIETIDQVYVSADQPFLWLRIGEEVLTLPRDHDLKRADRDRLYAALRSRIASLADAESREGARRSLGGMVTWQRAGGLDGGDPDGREGRDQADAHGADARELSIRVRRAEPPRLSPGEQLALGALLAAGFIPAMVALVMLIEGRWLIGFAVAAVGVASLAAAPGWMAWRHRETWPSHIELSDDGLRFGGRTVRFEEIVEVYLYPSHPYVLVQLEDGVLAIPDDYELDAVQGRLLYEAMRRRVEEARAAVGTGEVHGVAGTEAARRRGGEAARG